MENQIPNPQTLKFQLNGLALRVVYKARGSEELTNPVDLSMRDAQVLATHYRDKPYEHGYWNAVIVCLEKMSGIRD